MYSQEYYREAKQRQKQKILHYLGNKCAHCGLTHDLQVDHIDPTTKTFSINKKQSLKNPDVLEELAKCQLLCKLCHEKKTASENAGFTHGSLYGWMKARCSCSLCVQAHEEHNQKRRNGRLAKSVERA